MISSTVRNQLIATTFLIVSATLFASTTRLLNQLATGWTALSAWTATLGVLSLAAAAGPWLWAQTVRGQRLLISAVLVGSGGGLLGLLPGMSYQVVVAAQAVLAAAVIAESRSAR